MQKRGQAVIFLIVGILIIFLAAAVFFLTSEKVKTDAETQVLQTASSQDIKPQIVSFVQNCLEKQAIRGINIAGIQGGRIFVPNDKALITENAIISYSHLSGDDLLNLGTTEKDLGVFIDLTMDECTEYFSQFKNEGRTIIEVGNYPVDTKLVQMDFIEFLPLKSEVTIADNFVEIKAMYPLKIEKGNDVFNLDSFNVKIPSNLGQSIKDAITISKQENFDLSYFSDFEPFIKIIPYDGENVIYSQYYGKENLPIVFMYAVNKNE